MTLKKRIQQLAAPSGADFQPKYMIKSGDFGVGSTTVNEAVQFDKSDLHDTLYNTTLFSLPKMSMVYGLYLRVDTATTAARTLSIGIPGTAAALVAASATSATATFGTTLAQKGTQLKHSSTITSKLYTANSTNVIATFNSAINTGKFTAWIHYTTLLDPTNEDIVVTKPAVTPYFKIREEK